MKKTFKFYVIAWAICLVIFNVIAFVTPNEIAGISKFDGAFWAGYIFITLAFIGQLACAYIAFKSENLKKLFYNIPLISISYIGLAVMLVVGGIAMTTPGFPSWLGIILCLLVLGFSAVSVIKASASADIISKTDEKVDTKTAFIREMTVDAQNLINRANAPMLKEQCKKVYEALRYSDPISHDSLSDIEHMIKEEFDTLTDAIITDDLDATESSVKELKILISERNNKCKLLK
ncbi:MAG: hypothetical protein E7660_05820 [Ruminococcaceae bacterium]|nr:hypothetical protein [Oscillospiraceae bacterium]